MQKQINFIDQAEINKNDGMLRSSLNADSKIPGWNECAFEALRQFLNSINDNTFMAEDIRAWASTWGLDNPPSKRAWGAVINRAAKEKLIVFCGYSKTSNPTAHATPAGLWKKINKS